eukprot:13593584-Heterocapsa_arctica.AAC.1
MPADVLPSDVRPPPSVPLFHRPPSFLFPPPGWRPPPWWAFALVPSLCLPGSILSSPSLVARRS